MLDVWEVWARRTERDEPVRVGAVKAPDLEMALLLAREAFFRHSEAGEGWVGRDGERRAIPFPLQPVSDKSYRRPDGYVGVGAKHAKAAEEIAARGLAITRPRPPRT